MVSPDTTPNIEEAERIASLLEGHPGATPRALFSIVYETLKVRETMLANAEKQDRDAFEGWSKDESRLAAIDIKSTVTRLVQMYGYGETAIMLRLALDRERMARLIRGQPDGR